MQNRINKQLDAQSITRFHDSMLDNRQAPREREASKAETDDRMDERITTAWHWIGENHQCNTLLWNEEDKARRTDVADAEIVACKRLIDRHNQKRNDAVEAIDESLLALLDCERYAGRARLNSETAGSMIDRLSILSLKIFHMREQTLRTDADAQHLAACGAKLERLMQQRHDLGSCFDELLADAATGRAYFKSYRQFKMYNDPALNPYLYAPQGGRRAAGASAA